MALIKENLATSINLLIVGYNPEAPDSVKEQISQFASDLAGVIDAYVKSATVTTTVTGTSATGGPVTGTGTGSLQ